MARFAAAHPLPTLLLLLCLGAGLAEADEAVRFDAPAVVGCLDVTPEVFREVNPGERLIEVHVPISSLIAYDQESRTLQFLYTLECLGGEETVVDYLPKTTLTSPVAGEIGVEQAEESSQGASLKLTGAHASAVTANGQATADRNERVSLKRKYALLPPLKLLAASGTTGRGAGVFFKLKPSGRSSLDGAKDFLLVLRVPADWRASHLRLTCESLVARSPGLSPLERPLVERSQSFQIAIHQEGDAAARWAAQQFAAAEQSLRRTAARDRKRIERAATPNLAHQFGQWLNVSDRQVPADWLSRLLSAPPEAEPAFLGSLPEEVREAAIQYLAAKRNLSQVGAAPHVTWRSR